MRSKYHNRKEDGFDSRKEQRRYQELQLMQRAGEIKELQRQVRFHLLPNQYRNGKCILRGSDYIADFTYRLRDGTFVVEDAKGFQTDVYKLKKKLMYEKFGILIHET